MKLYVKHNYQFFFNILKKEELIIMKLLIVLLFSKVHNAKIFCHDRCISYLCYHGHPYNDRLSDLCPCPCPCPYLCPYLCCCDSKKKS